MPSTPQHSVFRHMRCEYGAIALKIPPTKTSRVAISSPRPFEEYPAFNQLTVLLWMFRQGAPRSLGERWDCKIGL
ncbi:hypothetical protein SAMN05444164_3213 [Bradyrhizobium erythrophlei]|uniref:Uncharacterized protein n=1 Tax=Bradyrhizobium erythrophlei TaxID=1437360 RepID=A0A1H4WQY5_9BRAD|nr:hypothetical protein SAMN05444164_3213 [Bradyrhizobium erythrophlei]